MAANNIVIFDGVCNLCHGAVRFIIERDPHANFSFCTQQSETGQRLLQQHGLLDEATDTVILIQGAQCFTESDAVLEISKNLAGAWPLLRHFSVLPKPVRNSMYRLVAKYRYRFFGKREYCLYPSETLKSRFLE
ncbi:thiol-disulfide oxidoreductase DCC family protein [Vibrio profundi]|uniref:thiol-disulfide oxidoreductase DCC family protein n=1 Tax=Vibrio profundi TaxID=1774960 RepID=UPI0037354375